MFIFFSFFNPDEPPPPPPPLPKKWLRRLFNYPALNTTGAVASLTGTWALVSRLAQSTIVQTITRMVTNEKALLLCLDGLVGLAKQGGGAVAMVVLSAVYLSYQALSNLRQWWSGEISGVRCAKNIIDSLGGVAAGVGGVVGAIIGSVVSGPLGILAGGIIGGLVGAHLARILLDRLTQKIFGVPKTGAKGNAYANQGVPKTETEEKAYAFLGVPMTASNSEVNTAYRRLCRKHHPDKGGRAKEFLVVQAHMNVIRAARGNL